MSFTQKIRNTANTFTGRIRQRIVTLFLATEDNKYIVTETGLKLLVVREGGFTNKPRNI